MTMTPPTADWNEAPLRCTSLNEAWLSFIVGQVLELEETRFWDSDQERATDQISAWLDDFILGECPVAQTYEAYAEMRNEQSSGTAGGGYTSGVNAYPFNAGESSDDALIAADLAHDLFIALAGDYEADAYIQAVANVTNPTNFTLRVYDQTHSANLLLGMSQRFLADQRGTLHLHGFFTLSADADLVLNFSVSQTRATNGLGVAITDGVTEVYGIFQLKKLLVP